MIGDVLQIPKEGGMGSVQVGLRDHLQALHLAL